LAYFCFESGAGNDPRLAALCRVCSLVFFPPIDPAGNGAAAHGGPRRVQLDGSALVAAGPAAASRNQWRPRIARLLPLLSNNGSRSWGRSARPGGCFLTVYDTGKPEYKPSCIRDILYLNIIRKTKYLDCDTVKILQIVICINPQLCCRQCCGSVTFWCGSDPRIRTIYLRLRIRIRIQILFFCQLLTRCRQKYVFYKCLCLLLFEATFTSQFLLLSLNPRSLESCDLFSANQAVPVT
jgi:hypothetical protein